MRIKKYILPVCLTGIIILQSCEDFLDTMPKESYSDETVWASQGTVDAFIVNNYANCYGYYLDFETWERWFANNMTNCRQAASGYTRGLMENTFDCGVSGNFGVIRNCNLIMEKVTESTILDESYKKRYMAEAKMMRAMVYYNLARQAGRFIWVDKVLTTEDNFDIGLTGSIAESYSYVLKDLREAIPDLPTNVKTGRLNKNAGYAMLSEVCLTAAAYTNNDKSLYVSPDVDLYQEAVKAVDAIEGISLDPDYESIFNEKGAYTSPEIILAQYWAEDATQVVSTDMINLVANIPNTKLATTGCKPLFNNGDIFSGGWMEYSPTQNLVDDYLVVDQNTGKAVRWYESSQFVNGVRSLSRDEVLNKIEHKDDKELVEGQFKAWEVTTPGVSISDLMYRNRDKRFDASILHDGSQFYGETLAMCNHGNMSRWATSNYFSDHAPVSNYATRKGIYTNLSPYLYYNVSTPYHKVVFRYGRALLNKAEALLQLNRVEEAVAAYNQTRILHGGLPASTAGSLEDAREEYMIERRVELFKEADFYFSLLRWGKYGWNTFNNVKGGIIKELCEPATFIEISKEREAAYVGNIQMNNDQRTFDVKSYLFPIPQGLINSNPAISSADQNPGWE